MRKSSILRYICKSLSLSWLPRMDSNHDKVIQSHLCYRYTTRQYKVILSPVSYQLSHICPQILGEMHGVFRSPNLQEIFPSASPDTASKARSVGMKNHPGSPQRQETPRFINPHRLFHGVWLPQWLEERPEVSEKAKKLYAYLTYFAGGKGCSWPSFGLLAEKLHCSRRHVMRLVQELSAHRLITVTNVSNPERGHCANYYRFLWHPWMQNERDASFVLAAPESEPLDASGESPDNCQADRPPSDIRVTSPLVTSRPPAPGDMSVTSPGDMHVTPLVTPMSPKENNKKRTNYRGKVPVTSSSTSPVKGVLRRLRRPPRLCRIRRRSFSNGE